MKICKTCFAEYDDNEVSNQYQFCIECYGEGIDVNLVDKGEFMKSVSVDGLKEKMEEIKISHINEQSKNLLTKRIEKLIQEKMK